MGWSKEIPNQENLTELEKNEALILHIRIIQLQEFEEWYGTKPHISMMLDKYREHYSQCSQEAHMWAENTYKLIESKVI